MVYGKLRPLYVDGCVLLDRSFLLTIFVFIIFFHLLLFLPCLIYAYISAHLGSLFTCWNLASLSCLQCWYGRKYQSSEEMKHRYSIFAERDD
ncbi:hypothetical protein Hanom_Chr01g00082781 [Helianthus anomalus]